MAKIVYPEDAILVFMNEEGEEHRISVLEFNEQGNPIDLNTDVEMIIARIEILEIH